MLYGLNKIGVLGAHGDGVNAIPAPFAVTPALAAYREGTAMRQLATSLADVPGIVNLRPETANLSWAERARRLDSAGCDLGMDLHTNWSLNSSGQPNRGILTVIVALYNPVHGAAAQQAMARQLFEPLARSMGLAFEIRTKKGSGEWDWYSFIYECNKKAVPYPMIVEHGYHLDFAPDVPGNITKVKRRYQEIAETPVPDTYYRVHTGEYATDQQTSQALAQARGKGYSDAFVNRYPSVQVGSYASPEAAEAALRRLRSEGFDQAFISIYRDSG